MKTKYQTAPDSLGVIHSRSSDNDYVCAAACYTGKNRLRGVSFHSTRPLAAKHWKLDPQYDPNGRIEILEIAKL